MIFLMIGCTVDLEPETLEFMEEVQNDCLELKDDLERLLSVIEFYAYSPYDNGALARETLSDEVE